MLSQSLQGVVGGLLRCLILACLLISLLLASSIEAVMPSVRIVSVSVGQQGWPNAWPMMHHDAARTGFVDGSAPHALHVLWSYTVGAPIAPYNLIESSPLIESGTVYFAAGGYVYALNQSNGQLRWRTPNADDPLIIYGDSLYAGGGDCLCRINASTGTVLWRKGLSDGISMVVANDRIYIAEYHTANITSVDAETGGVLWSSHSFGVSVPGWLAYANGIVYGVTVSGPGQVVAFNATTGALIWSYYPQQGGYAYAISGGPTVVGGILYAGGSPNGDTSRSNLTAFDAATGRVIWETSALAWGPPAVAYGRLYVSYEAGVAAYNLNSGIHLWDFPTEACCSMSEPAVADGLVFFGGGGTPIPSPYLYAVNATTGVMVWNLTLPDAVDSSPAISNGTIYIGSGIGLGNGTLFAIGSQQPSKSASPVSGLLLEVAVSALLIVGILTVVSWRHRRKPMV